MVFFDKCFESQKLKQKCTKSNPILKGNVRALNKEFKSVIKAINKRKYTTRGTEKNCHSKERIAERKANVQMRREERALRKLNAPAKQKQNYTRKK